MYTHNNVNEYSTIGGTDTCCCNDNLRALAETNQSNARRRDFVYGKCPGGRLNLVSDTSNYPVFYL